MNEPEAPRSPPGPEGRGYEIYLPLLLVIVAVAAWFSFQTVQLVKERSSLERLMKEQETTLQNAQKMRTQLNAIATGLARLAQQGNADAKLVMKALRQRGIVVHTGEGKSKDAHP